MGREGEVWAGCLANLPEKGVKSVFLRGCGDARPQ